MEIANDKPPALSATRLTKLLPGPRCLRTYDQARKRAAHRRMQTFSVAGSDHGSHVVTASPTHRMRMIR